MPKDNVKLNIAYKYTSKNFSQDDIIDILKGEDELLKPVAILNLKALDSELGGQLLLSHLTGVDGKIREVVSYRITELYCECSQFLDFPEFPHLLRDALCDVNPNVVRNILELLTKYPHHELITGLIMERIEEILDDIDKICSKFKRNREKSHALNIKLFNLYWCLEGIYCTIGTKSSEHLNKILLRCSDMYDYTIREKTAKILTKIESPPSELLSKLRNDVNFYVKRHLCGNI